MKAVLPVLFAIVWTTIGFSQSTPNQCSPVLNLSGDRHHIKLNPSSVPTTDISVATWIKPEDLTNGAVFTWGASSGCGSQALRVQNDKLTWTYSCGNAVVGTTTLNAGTWYFVGITVDVNGTATLYLNGQQETSVNNGQQIQAGSGVGAIGAAYDQGVLTDYFEGSMSDFSLWGRVLSAAEMADLQNNSPSEFDQDMIAYYPFDEGAGFVIHDEKPVMLRSEFNGTNTATSLPTSFTNSATNYSVGMTITPNNVTEGTLFRIGPISGCNPSSHSLQLRNGKLRARTGCGSSVESTLTLQVGQTYEIFMTVSSNFTTFLYINGVEQAQGNTSSGNSVTVGFPTIGADANAGSITDFYDGEMDNVSLWNTQLSGTQVLGLSGTTPNLNDQNLFGYFVLSDFDTYDTQISSYSEFGGDAEMLPGINYPTSNIRQDAFLEQVQRVGYFNGVSTRLDVSQNFALGSGSTLHLEITPDDVNNGTIAFTGPTTGCDPSSQFLYLDEGKLKFKTGCGTGELVSTTTFVPGQTYQVTLTSTPENAQLAQSKLYVNGQLEDSGNTTGGNSVGAGVSRIGAISNGGSLSDYFRGYMDNLSVWTKELQLSEVTDLANGSALNTSDVDLLLWYDISNYDGSGTMADISNNNNTAAVVDMSDTDGNFDFWTFPNGTNTPPAVNLGISVSGTLISLDEPNVSNIDWIDCDTETVVSQNGSGFYSASSGSYAAIINDNGCVDTTACVNVLTVGIDDLEENEVSVFPNPNNGNFRVVVANNNQGSYTLTDVTGRIVNSGVLRSGDEFKLHEAGLYILDILLNDGELSTHKIIVR